MNTPSPNFAYLAHHDVRLVALATQAEQQFSIDPAVTIMKLRAFAELLAQRTAVFGARLADPERDGSVAQVQTRHGLAPT